MTPIPPPAGCEGAHPDAPPSPSLLLRSLLLILPGMAISGYGARMAFQSGVGVAPIYMVDEGISNLFHVDLGIAIVIVGLIIFPVGFLLDRHSVGLTTVLTTLILGPMVDLMLPLLPPVPESYPARFAYMLLGLVINAAGIAVYLYPDRGGSCLEIIMLCVSRRTGLAIGTARVLSDVLWFAIGWVLGGTWGWGTLVSLLLTGPLLQFWVRVLRPILTRFYKRPVPRELSQV